MSISTEKRQPAKTSKISQRWVTVCLGLLGLFNAYSMRICLSIAITEMTFSPNHTAKIHSDDTCTENNNYNVTQLKFVKHSNGERYEWSERMQGLILSSFYWGYTLSCIVGGMICQKFGGKHTLGLGVLFTSIFTLITPYCIHWGGATGLIILRIAVGFGEGTTFPAISDLLSKWIPEEERSRAGTVAFSGGPLGTIFGMAVSGIILEYSKAGWPMVFYFYGSVGLISFLLNALFCYNQPSENPYISDEELAYLKSKIKNTHKNLPATPWRYMLTSPAVLATFAAKFGTGWILFTLISDMPKYMSSVLKFSAKDNGYLSSIPHLSMWIGSMMTCWIADKMIAEKILSITVVRKVCFSITTLGPAIFLIAASYAGCDGIIVVTLQSIGLALFGSLSSSVLINAVDLSPNYASSIMGYGNSVSAFSGILAPYIVGVLTPNQTISEWRLVFWIVLAVAIVSDVSFIAFASGEVQAWNDPSFLEKKSMSNNGVKNCDILIPLNDMSKKSIDAK